MGQVHSGSNNKKTFVTGQGLILHRGSCLMKKPQKALQRHFPRQDLGPQIRPCPKGDAKVKNLERNDIFLYIFVTLNN